MNPKEVATVRRVVRRINERLPAGRFLVAAHRRRRLLYYCLASGDPRTARYEVTDAPVDLAELAGSVGVRLSASELDALHGSIAA